MEYVWGAVLVGCGIFIAVYGNLLFRFVLAVIGFALGFTTAVVLLDSQDGALRIAVGLVAGVAGAAVLYALFDVGLFVAGGILGFVAAIVVASLFNQLDDGVGWIGAILMAAGTGAGAFFGRRLGDLVVILATASAGAFLVVYGIMIWFDDRFATNLDDPSGNLAQNLTLLLFVAMAAISGLAQYNIMDLRRRLMR